MSARQEEIKRMKSFKHTCASAGMPFYGYVEFGLGWPKRNRYSKEVKYNYDQKIRPKLKSYH